MKPLEEDDMDNYTSGGLGTVFSFVSINTSTLNICFCGQEKPPSYSGGWSYVTGSVYNQDISFKRIMSINTSRMSSFHPSMVPNLCRGRIFSLPQRHRRP